MSDVNEQSFSAGSANDTAPARHSKSLRQRIPNPIWRFRPTLQPVAVVKTLNDALAKVLAQPDFKEKLSAEAVELLPMTPEAFGAFMRADIARWNKVARERNIRLES